MRKNNWKKWYFHPVIGHFYIAFQYLLVLKSILHVLLITTNGQHQSFSTVGKLEVSTDVAKWMVVRHVGVLLFLEEEVLLVIFTFCSRLGLFHDGDILLFVRFTLMSWI